MKVIYRLLNFVQLGAALYCSSPSNIYTRNSHKFADVCLLKVNRNNFMKTTCVGLKRDISCSYFENMNHVVQCVIY